MLFNVSGGLQILPTGKENVTENWELKESAVIPLLREGEVNDDRSVSEWMIWKITKGELRVQTAEEKQVAVTG
ncbi:uncharacterized protein BO96DRAFT_444606 [Aspergillus niger CBS 101883]|uniref:uncharacterized protein n=1 Tax=Aspergillus lacticoffeatus (strain CBS 101883) TaxID=1450533 RepID=UPI000D7F6446|nr:uncharacterized protein BO96DRAFT_444606 [Aspergillus niger CBS 101883]PYH57921.1 hypothetical protein BO96DRAFT_444606 [Aspergillus niger CBS 101883]